MRTLVLILMLTVLGCPTPVCNPTETRCSSAVAEICGSDGQWRELMNCEPEGMVCCWLPEDPDGIPAGYSCMPECPTVDGGE